MSDIDLATGRAPRTRRGTAPLACDATADVLVADASALAGNAMAALLRAQGYAVVTCGNGAQALGVAFEVRPKCALLDVALPGINGMDVAHALRAAFDDGIVLVAVTALGNGDLRGFKYFTDFDCYFRKPADVATLLKVLPRASGRTGSVALSLHRGAVPTAHRCAVDTLC